jgi:ATP-dependent DNA helicase RecG
LPVESNRLRQVLELEGKRGYSDTAVFGGLDKLLANWFGPRTIVPSERVDRLRSLYPQGFSYANLTPAARKAWSEQVIVALENPDQSEQAVPSVPAMYVSEAKPELPKEKSKAASSPRAITGAPNDLSAPTISVKGISTVLAGKFARLGVKDLRDLLYYFPRRHLDYSHLETVSQLKEGRDHTLAANVWETRIIMPGGRRSTEAVLGDETGNVRAVWFNNP